MIMRLEGTGQTYNSLLKQIISTHISVYKHSVETTWREWAPVDWFCWSKKPRLGTPNHLVRNHHQVAESTAADSNVLHKTDILSLHLFLNTYFAQSKKILF